MAYLFQKSLDQLSFSETARPCIKMPMESLITLHNMEIMEIGELRSRKFNFKGSFFNEP